MVTCCCVPKCSTRSGGHAFPKDPGLRKKWLHATRRDNFKPTKHSRVCDKHFKATDFEEQSWASREAGVKHRRKLKQGSVPSVFEWSHPQKLSARDARKINRERSQKKHSHEATSEEALECEVHDVGAEEVIEEVVIGEDLVQETTHCNTQTSDQACQTDAPQESGQFGITVEKYKYQPKLIQHYTGFDNYDHFMFVFYLLGPAAEDLDYGPKGNKTCPLKPQDAFFLTLMKLRRNTSDLELADRFVIPEGQVGPIFHTWVNFMYFEMKEWNIQPADAAEADVKIIIDCTEFKIDRPSHPILQQATYSTYKSSNTLKVLVGISPSCLVTHVSDGYCGSYSDKSILQASKVLDQLNSGDVVLADRGFQIEQMCRDRGIVLNVPVRLRGKSQLSAIEMRNATYISSRRIHVERSIGLAKTYAILNVKFHQSRVIHASRIIFVCFMLANLRRKIV